MDSLGQARSRLQDQWRRLQQQWRATCELWRDPVQRQFKRELGQEYERTLPMVLKEMDKLADVSTRARREESAGGTCARGVAQLAIAATG